MFNIHECIKLMHITFFFYDLKGARRKEQASIIHLL